MAGGSLGDVVLKVDSQALYDKSQEVGRSLEVMRQSFAEMEAAAQGSQSYWQGEAAQAHRSACQDCQKEAEEIFRRIQEHVDELQEMAGVYEGAERAVEDLMETLPADVIV